MKIISFELENVKKVALVRLEPAENGLTVIGGDNASGKTSIIDGLVYALGGEKYRPSSLQRDGGMTPARIHIEMTDGIVVERKGKNASLTVTDATGARKGQALLDEFIDKLALNLPGFLAMRDDEKAGVLLHTLGIEEQLEELDLREKAAFDKRHDFGVAADQKIKYAREMREYADVPDTIIDAASILAEIRDIGQRNAERGRRRCELEKNLRDIKLIDDRNASIKTQIESMTRELDANTAKRIELESKKPGPVEPDESTDALTMSLSGIEETNAKVRANMDKAKAIDDAEAYNAQAETLTKALEDIRAERRALLDGAAMPLQDMTIEKDAKGRPILLYKGKAWDCMSTMEQYRVAVAIVRELKPECGFVLLDRMESFDFAQIAEFDAWLKEQGLQAICTRVGKDDACSIIIEDGYAVQDSASPATEAPKMDDPIPMDKPAPTAEELEF